MESAANSQKVLASAHYRSGVGEGPCTRGQQMS
ncbi:hypothetical protein FOQG_09566 [Fusarium oxysporum f. sp. raphani 54005]|uniref:Uncharacterized protein n=8 Tax=Fusarium oxysporum TaxID=5507 RepID=W9ILY1_FUSOX|nr:hypothetical protein FOXG_17912 [Fusarium oxysporum f. sp. lycopersici 4287]EWY93526.1 hypothetical protein FOYG_06695 [Fusarium oxysporum NRRL 32931]EWZ51163.1 hypothetical protein FOZG_01358 [Fusarium oxysporum Fo47]EWZ91365.1 hypothetical protein FOWG_06971 [Fusarium oxysporum f. sp. lycopersici MN25]EXA52618.1 hypothetical protein FOVG_00832 [Fusarium oxysporum f. sp. pisi HDV247]EXK48421.1 hypothetical protein FOMG_01363 [Fusarium oxysporum f. sp. melonis 26406]EXK86747.1 hypothetical